MKNPKGIQAFATHLRRLRDDKQISQQELADISDISKKTIQRIENAKSSPTVDVLISLSRAMKIPMSELMDFHLPREKNV